MKKVLSCVLALFIVITNMTMVIASDNTASASHVALLSDLGIDKDIIGNSVGDVTRAEFAAMIVRALNIDSSIYTDGDFEDIDDSPFKQEIAAAKKNGITNGTSAVHFSPDMGVTVPVAAKMMISALDYNTKAEAIGAYPAGYLRLASELDLLDDVDTSYETLKVSDAYTCIYNMLLADKAIFKSIEDGDISYTTEKGRNLLTENFRLTPVTGVVNTVSGYGVEYESASPDELKIGGRLLKCEKDYSYLLGLNVTAYYNDKNVVKAVDIDTVNKLVEINSEDVIEYASSKLSVDADGKTKNYSVSSGYSFIKNGRAIAADKSDFVFSEGNITLIDNDGNGSYDYVLAENPEYFVISSVNTLENEIYDSNSVFGYLSLEENDDYIVRLTINGVPASIGQLSKNMVCRVIKSDGIGEKGVCVIDCCEISVSGTVTALSDEEIYIDEKPYEYTSYFTNLDDVIRVGTKYDFLMTSDNKIVKASLPSSETMRYGYLMGYDAGSGLGATPQVKLLSDIGDIDIYDLKSKLVIDGTSMNKTDSSIPDMLSPYQLIKYKLNDSDEISHIDLAETAPFDWESVENKDDINNLTLSEAPTSITLESNSAYGVPNVPFASVGVIFSIPSEYNPNSDKYDPTKELADEYFRAMTALELQRHGDKSHNVSVYDYDEFSIPGAVIVYNDALDTGGFVPPAGSATSYIVHNITDCADEDGIIRKKLTVFAGNKYEYYLFDKDVEEYIAKKYAFPAPGDIVRLQHNAKNEINGIKIDVTGSGDSLNINYDGIYNGVAYPGTFDMSQSLRSYPSYVSGKVINANSSAMLITPENTPPGDKAGLEAAGVVNLQLSSPSVVVYDKTKGESYKGTLDDIITMKNAGELRASRVVCKAIRCNVGQVFIYLD